MGRKFYLVGSPSETTAFSHFCLEPASRIYGLLPQPPKLPTRNPAHQNSRFPVEKPRNDSEHARLV
ncbi:MAG: hypothetical protein RI897_1408 [Verrucomicrobiota bacterium]